MWKILRKIKRETPLDKICERTDVLYRSEDISSIVMDVEKQMAIKSSDQIFENMTALDLQNAGKMFLYLYTCPGVTNQVLQVSQSQKWFINWFTFYNDLFKASPNRILLTLNRMMKSSIHNDFIEELFKRMAKLLNLKYESIQSLLPEDKRNTNCSGSLSTFHHLALNLKGMLIVYFFFEDLYGSYPMFLSYLYSICRHGECSPPCAYNYL